MNIAGNILSSVWLFFSSLGPDHLVGFLYFGRHRVSHLVGQDPRDVVEVSDHQSARGEGRQIGGGGRPPGAPAGGVAEWWMWPATGSTRWKGGEEMADLKGPRRRRGWGCKGILPFNLFLVIDDT
jgi:hypothetical protein